MIEAAVQGLSAPRPADGEPDRRPSGQRRMDALLEVVRRGVASADGVATTPKAELFVTVSLDDLVARTERRDRVRVRLRPAPCSPPRPPAGSAATPGSCRWCWARTGRSSTWAAGSGSSPQPSCGPCGCATAGAPSPTAPCPRPGATATTCDIGPTAAPPTSRTPPCCAGGTTRIVHRKGYHGAAASAARSTWDLTPGAYDHWLAEPTGGRGGRAAAAPIGRARWAIGQPSGPTTSGTSPRPPPSASQPLPLWRP